MDYSALRAVADSLIDSFSNNQQAVLMKGEKQKDPSTGRIFKTYREIQSSSRAVMTSYSEEAIAASGGVLEAGDVKFVCRFSEAPTEIEDRIRFAGSEYNVIHCRSVDPSGEGAVVYVVQGRKA